MSRYLYSQENQDIYHKTLEEYNDKRCVFSRTLLAQLESSQLKESGPFYKKHLDECSVCQKLVKDFSLREKRIKQVIPFVTAPDYLAENLRPELKESLNYLKIKERQKNESLMTKEVMTESFKAFFISVPKSRTFHKGLLFGGLSWIVLKILL